MASRRFMRIPSPVTGRQRECKASGAADESSCRTVGSTGSKVEPQEGGTLDGIEAVGGRRLETERQVQRLSLLHEGQGVQQDAAIADLPRDRDAALDEHAAEAAPAGGWYDVEALDLANAFRERSQADTGEILAGLCRENECTSRRGVLAGEMLQLLVEVLKREIDVQRGRVLADESPRFVPLVRRRGLEQSD